MKSRIVTENTSGMGGSGLQLLGNMTSTFNGTNIPGEHANDMEYWRSLFQLPSNMTFDPVVPFSQLNDTLSIWTMQFGSPLVPQPSTWFSRVGGVSDSNFAFLNMFKLHWMNLMDATTLDQIGATPRLPPPVVLNPASQGFSLGMWLNVSALQNMGPYWSQIARADFSHQASSLSQFYIHWRQNFTMARGQWVTLNSQRNLHRCRHFNRDLLNEEIILDATELGRALPAYPFISVSTFRNLLPLSDDSGFYADQQEWRYWVASQFTTDHATLLPKLWQNISTSQCGKRWTVTTPQKGTEFAHLFGWDIPYHHNNGRPFSGKQRFNILSYLYETVNQWMHDSEDQLNAIWSADHGSIRAYRREVVYLNRFFISSRFLAAYREIKDQMECDDWIAAQQEEGVRKQEIEHELERHSPMFAIEPSSIGRMLSLNTSTIISIHFPSAMIMNMRKPIETCIIRAVSNTDGSHFHR